MTRIVQERRSRESGTLVQVIDNRDGSFDQGDLGWFTLCVEHSGVCSHETRALAESFASIPSEWCPYCAEVRDPGEVSSGALPRPGASTSGRILRRPLSTTPPLKPLLPDSILQREGALYTAVTFTLPTGRRAACIVADEAVEEAVAYLSEHEGCYSLATIPQRRRN